MILKPTTLILGAGSAPADFPRGRELVNIINNKLKSRAGNSDTNWHNIFPTLGFRDFEKIENFRNTLLQSDPPSIDTFLEYQPEFIEIGKLCIALALIPYEQPDKLMADPSINWYRYLRDSLLCKADQFVRNQLSIVTFNYDRSLEHYLFTSISYLLHLDQNKCAELLSRIPIVHVHGKLGNLPWQKSLDKYEQRSYADDSRVPTYAYYASKKIIIIPEAIDSSSEFDRARDLFVRSERIIFLGFGYHDKNLQRLKVDSLKGRDIRGTAFNFGDAEIAHLKRRCPNLVPAHPSFDIDRFFKEVIRFE